MQPLCTHTLRGHGTPHPHTNMKYKYLHVRSHCIDSRAQRFLQFVPIPKPHLSTTTYAHPRPPMLFKLRPCIQKL